MPALMPVRPGADEAGIGVPQGEQKQCDMSSSRGGT